MKALIKIIKAPENGNDPTVIFDIIDNEVLITSNFNCVIDPSGLSKSPDKKQFILRTINDVLKNYNNKKESLVGLDYWGQDLVNLELEINPTEPHAYQFMTPEMPLKTKEANDFLQALDLKNVNNTNDVKIIIEKILVAMGLK